MNNSPLGTPPKLRKMLATLALLAACLAVMLPAARALAAWGDGFYVTSKATLGPDDAVAVGGSLSIMVKGSAHSAPNAHEEEMLGHKWYDFGASFEIKATEADTYEPAPPGSYTWVTHFPSGSQQSANATATVKFNVSGYWRITGHASAAYWSSDDGKESGHSDEVSDGSE